MHLQSKKGLHDIGRAISVEDHARAGAKWSRDFLKTVSLPGDNETLPIETVKRIARIVACHRSQIVLNRPFNDSCWAVIVLADKFAGDEDRVRPGRAFVMSVLTLFGLSFVKLRHDGIHDRVNFAIKEVDVLLRGNELLLRQVLDPRVCPARLVLDTYSDRYLACHKAAAYLGLRFVLEAESRPVYGPVAAIRQALGFAGKSSVERFSFMEGQNRWISN